MQKNIIIIVSIIFVVAILGYGFIERAKLAEMLNMPMLNNSQEAQNKKNTEEKNEDKKAEVKNTGTKNIPVKQVTEKETKQPEEKSYFGDLIDVTKGGKGNGSGIAQASFKNKQYQLVARFKNLPEPNGTDFYEGWIVRKGLNFSVLSTGKAIKENGEYINVFSSDKDLTDHDFYVLTLEPDDGDPAPAAHILEGTLKLK